MLEKEWDCPLEEEEEEEDVEEEAVDGGLYCLLDEEERVDGGLYCRPPSVAEEV